MVNQQKQYRGEGATIALAAALGIIGVCGIGHIYVGRLARGCVILVTSLVIGAVGLVLALATLWYPEFVFVPLAAYLGFYAWSVLDARRIVKRHNASLGDAGETEAAESEPTEQEVTDPKASETDESEAAEQETAKPNTDKSDAR